MKTEQLESNNLPWKAQNISLKEIINFLGIYDKYDFKSRDKAV